MNRISRTWELANISWSVLRADKELMLLPIMSAVCTLLVTASFIMPIITIQDVRTDLEGSMNNASPALYAGLFLFYLANYFVVIFFNTALIGAATMRLRGGDPTLRDGLAFAWANAGRIMQWAIVSATVGMVLRAIEERVGWLGKVVVGMFGAAWSLATYFVIPVMVYEDVGPMEAVRESASLFTRTWGERVVGSISFGLLFFLMAIPAFIAVAIAASLGTATLIVIAILSTIYVLTLVVINAALNGIFVAALYQYAQSGATSGPFTPQLLKGAWLPK